MTIKPFKFSFYKSLETSSWSLRDAQPIQSTQALAGINIILKTISEVNQRAYDTTRNLDEFTVTVTPIPGSKDHGLQISGKNIEINIAKLKPQTQAHFLPLRSALKSPDSNRALSHSDTISSMNISSFLKDTLLLWSMAVSTFRQWMRSLGKLIFGDSAKEPKQDVSLSPPTIDGSYSLPEKPKEAVQLAAPSKSETVAAQPDVFYDLDDEATHRRSDTGIFDIAERKKEDRLLRKQKEKLQKQHKREKGKAPAPIKSPLKTESEPAEIKAEDGKQTKTPDTVYRLPPRPSKDLPTPLEIPPEPSPVQLEAKEPQKNIQKDVLTTFVFKREGERFQMSEARLHDGTPYKSPKVESVMQSILVQSSEYQKISKHSELKVTLSSSSPPVVRIQSNDNGGLDITLKQLKSGDGNFLVGKALNPLDNKQPSNKPETLESFAAKIFSWVKKPEMARKFLQELKEKPLAQEEGVQNLLKSLVSSVDRLINSEDPIVERALDHILAQKDALLACTSSTDFLGKAAQLVDAINMALRYIEVAELGRQIETLESDFSRLKPAYLTATLTVRLKDANEFLESLNSEWLEKDLEKNRENLKRHADNRASLLKEIDEMEDLLAIRNPAEQKAKLNNFIAQNAGEPFFQEMSNVSAMITKIFDLLREHENAYTIYKPVLWAKIASYGPSLMISIPKLQKQLSEKSFRTFLFLFMDIFVTEAKKTFGENASEKFLPLHRTGVAEEVEVMRKRASIALQEIERCQKSEKDSIELLKIAKDRKNLYQLYQESPQAKEEIEQLENTKYALSGTTLSQTKKWLGVSEKNPIVQNMAEMGAKEYEEAENKLENIKFRYKREHSILTKGVTAKQPTKS
jgi:hypothetical protein